MMGEAESLGSHPFSCSGTHSHPEQHSSFRAVYNWIKGWLQWVEIVTRTWAWYGAGEKTLLYQESLSADVAQPWTSLREVHLPTIFPVGFTWAFLYWTLSLKGKLPQQWLTQFLNIENRNFPVGWLCAQHWDGALYCIQFLHLKTENLKEIRVNLSCLRICFWPDKNFRVTWIWYAAVHRRVLLETRID